MATTPPVIQAKITSDPVKLPIAPLLAAVVLGVVVATIAVGGVVYYLIRSGKVPVQTTAAQPAARVLTSTRTYLVTLEPLLVNLADSSGSAFLRVSLTLQIADPAGETGKDARSETKAATKGSDAAVRDTALTVLGRETSERLLASEGKERLKKELKAAFTEHDSELKITDLFFTEFLVQR